MRTALILALVMLASILPASVMLMQPPSDTQEATSQEQPLPKIAPAPGFTLTSQDGAQMSARGPSRQGGRRNLHLHLVQRTLAPC